MITPVRRGGARRGTRRGAPVVDDLRSAGPRPADPRLAELRAAAQALRRELAGYRGDPADLRAAEEGLDAVDAHLL
ncbi:DUF5955 family protein, partial [Streptomyces sp. NPDC059506]|uniref:DUF5955 family protein n=1 Tax=Streptomyces sp. NPDC059506 TaxID=3347751 RepID=UPI0036A2E91C